MAGENGALRVGYVLKKFPRISETFILNEILELERQGVTLHRWPPEILGTLRRAWNEVADEWAAEDAAFKRTWESLRAFRAEYAPWKDLGYLN